MLGRILFFERIIQPQTFVHRAKKLECIYSGYKVSLAKAKSDD